MKIRTLIFLSVLALGYAPGLVQKPKNSCNALVVEKISFGIDSLKAMVFQDTVHVMYIKVSNWKKGSNLQGPDYCLFSVIDRTSHDTLAVVPINGVPKHFGESREYPASETEKHPWKKRPDLKKIRIALPPYCEDIKIRL